MRKVVLLIIIGLLGLLNGVKASEKDYTLPPAIILPIDSIKVYDSGTYWRWEGRTRLNMNTILLSNWADGGESSFSTTAYFDLVAKYEKGNFKFENYLNTAYGLQLYRYSGTRKSEDKLNLNSSVAHQFVKNYFYNAQLDFKSQYSEGFKYPNDSTVVSDWFAPAYLTLSLGIENKSIEGLSMFFAPVAGKLIFVMNQDLADAGSYGVKAAVKDEEGNILVPGDNIKAELGVNIKLRYRKELFKNIDVSSTMNLYNNYADPDPSNQWNIDVDWETLFDFTINKYFVANLYLHMIYDHNVKVPEYEVVDGDRIKTGESINLQVKQNYGFGIAFKF
ncbi:MULTISPECIES: DUF3078 domain-containing protein [unclassified Lentimicrobium]|uniref:DUF3078 domain-containing protein n=1 Tax=unclassified Lentimicrobium TaxID=2677434 RepID=UPI001556F803|nr:MULTISPECIES: DUF3078 domain-containing protein [unclassified Lentimicrobium]NPD46866.1 DUF3078 domain-containing protein [Lentimicrobium sp. S6]NPD84449.1 DUF3078 domain-containing protein [Lentimicrobium sp. L6]